MSNSLEGKALPSYVKTALNVVQDHFDLRKSDLLKALEATQAGESEAMAWKKNVKSLIWEELSGGKSFRAYLPILGSVRVEPYGCLGWWEVLWSMPGQCDKLIPDVFDNADDAKAAAQNEYENRILSVLTAPPSLAAVQSERDKWHQIAMDAGVIVHTDGTTSHSMRKERDDLQADNERLREALKTLMEINDDFTPFGGEFYRDRVDRAWDKARAVLAGQEKQE